MLRVVLSGEPFTVVQAYDKFWRKATAGRWEASTFEVMRSHVDAETVVIDIGAWIGPTVLFAARRARRVEAFEPDPVSAAMLRQNLALNAPEAAKVRVHEKAVWTSPGTVAMGNAKAKGDSTSSVLLPDAVHQWEAATLTVGDLAAMVAPEEKLFIKLDVEGAEYALLTALAPLLARPRVSVLVAFHPRMVSPRRSPLVGPCATTRAAFMNFDGFAVRRLSRRAARPAVGAELGRRTGLWAFEADGNYLFTRDA